jgi:hypothetical protein
MDDVRQNAKDLFPTISLTLAPSVRAFRLTAEAQLKQTRSRPHTGQKEASSMRDRIVILVISLVALQWTGCTIRY